MEEPVQMKKREIQLVKNTGLYLVANLGTKLCVMILYPMYTYFILPEQLGEYDLIISTLTLLYPIVVFAINFGLFRWLLDAKRDDIEQIISVGMKVTIRNIIVSEFLFIILCQFINIPYAIWIGLLLPIGALFPVLQQISRGLKQNKIYAISGLINAVTLLISTFVFLFFLHLKVEGALASQILSHIIALLYILITTKKLHFNWFRIKTDAQLSKKMQKYSLMLIPNTSSWWIMNASDRYIINYILGNYSNGIYAISHKFPSLMSIFTGVFNLAWQEQGILESKSSDKDAYFSRIYNIYSRFLMLSAIILLPVVKILTRYIIQQTYFEAWKYSSELFIGSTFLALASFLGTGYLSDKSTKNLMYSSVCGAMVNIFVDLILIPKIGIEGAAVGTLIGNFITWLWRYIDTRKYYIIKVDWLKFSLSLLSYLILSVLLRNSTSLIDFLLFAVTFFAFVYFQRDILKSLGHKGISFIRSLRRNK